MSSISTGVDRSCLDRDDEGNYVLPFSRRTVDTRLLRRDPDEVDMFRFFKDETPLLREQVLRFLGLDEGGYYVDLDSTLDDDEEDEEDYDEEDFQREVVYWTKIFLTMLGHEIIEDTDNPQFIH